MFPKWYILLRQSMKININALNKFLVRLFLTWNLYPSVRSGSKYIQEWANAVGTRFTFLACACSQLIALLSGQLNSIRLPPYTPSLGCFSRLLWLRQCGSTPGHLSWSTRIAGIATPAPCSHCIEQVSTSISFRAANNCSDLSFCWNFPVCRLWFLGFPQRKTFLQVFDFDFDFDFDMNFIVDWDWLRIKF